jgi:hypothetical protein
MSAWTMGKLEYKYQTTFSLHNNMWSTSTVLQDGAFYIVLFNTTQCTTERGGRGDMFYFRVSINFALYKVYG